MAYRRNGMRRKFVWARQAGILDLGTSAAAFDAVDLLGSVKERFGGENFVGATVMTVKGYMRPAGDTTVAVRGRIGMRVCNEGDVGEGGSIEDGPGDGFSVGGNPEADWMGFFPFYLPPGRGPDTATWNVQANQYAIHMQAPRRMEELGQTLGLFADVTEQTTGGRVDYDLSVGLKLA